MRYFAFMITVLLILVDGVAFAHENATDNEEATHAAVDREIAVIRNKVNDIKEVIQADYEVLLVSEPGAQGTVTISFSITPEGAVTDTVVGCPEELSDIEANITKAIGELEFEPTEHTENLPITVPFDLMPPE